MATRVAQVVIQVDDKSLVELNAEIKALETSVKNLKIGTTEWVAQNQKLGTLKDRFKQATDEAKKLQGQVQKITGADQVRSIAKLGAGMVGAFSAVSGSLKLLGINSEAFDKMTATATTLMSVMGGLNQISELFSTTNLKGLKGIAAGFSGLVTTVKGASTAMKAALISTGIGALVVGLGLVIANWDKIKNAVLGVSRKEQEAFDKSQKYNEENIKNLTNLNRLLEDRITLLQSLDASDVQFTGEGEKYLNIVQATNKLIENRIELYNAEITKRKEAKDDPKIKKDNEELDKKLNKDKKNFDDAATKYEEMAARLLTTNKLLQTENFLKFGDLEAQKQLLINLQANVKKYSDIFQITAKTSILNQKNKVTAADELINLQAELAYYKDILATRKKIASDQNDANLKRNLEITQLENGLDLLETQSDTEKNIYNARGVVIQKQIEGFAKIMAAGGTLTIQEKEQLAVLETQLDILDKEETLRLHNVKLATDKYEKDLDDLEVNKQLNDQIADLNLKYIILNAQNKNDADARANQTKELENQIALINDQTKTLEERQKFWNTLNEKHKTNTAESIVRLEKERELNDEIGKLTQIKLINDKILINNQIERNDLKQKEKQDDIDILNQKLKINQNEIVYTKTQLELNRKDTFTSKAEKQQKEIELTTKLFTLEESSKTITTSIVVANQEILDAKDENVKANLELLKTDQAINKSISDTAEKEKEITAEIAKRIKLYKRLQTFVNNYNEEIQAGLRAIEASMEVIASLFERRAANIQDNIDRLNIEYDNMMRLEEDRQDKLLKYEEELKDANGTRYDELLKLIDQEKKAKNTVFIDEKAHKNEIARLDHQRLVAEHQAAQWRKAQAIIDAVVQGALAVIKALPNIFLSVAVGIASAAAVATIAAQKIPDVPPLVQYKKGGYTGEGDENEIAGVAHKKEYIVPAKVVKMSQAEHHIAALESMRNKGYQSGGFVAPVNNPSPPQFEYDKLVSAMADAFLLLPNPQVGLVNISNGLKQVELTKSQAGISR